MLNATFIPKNSPETGFGFKKTGHQLRKYIHLHKTNNAFKPEGRELKYIS